MTITEDTHVSAIVAENPRAAAVFERFGIDFCCGGQRPLGVVSRERGVALPDLLEALSSGDASAAGTVPRFTTWSLGLLVDYIVENHHAWVRQASPVLLQHTRKIAQVHGRNHPELVEIAAQFETLAEDLELHMMKEEQVLFPYLKELGEARRGGRPQAGFMSAGGPIAMMMREHEQAGGEMATIRALSHDFTVPEDACGTFRACFQELRDFERDLHQHVHLENNVLFPRALEEEHAG
ncbi:MAG: iron-sulfur cluster repair di-iron protein [Acidobacteriota bacterium]|nr:iron-sulfur cluster repair di-iron protein [Acidobacteriota bacterium]